MIKRICSVWLVGAIIVSAGTALTSHTSLVEAPVVALAAAFAPQPLVGQDPECDACKWSEGFPQCCLGCGDVPEPDPELEYGTNCRTPTQEGCEFDDPCEPTLAFHLLRGGGTLTLVDAGRENGAGIRSFPVTPALSGPLTDETAAARVLVACDGSVVGREYSKLRMAAIREASKRLAL